MSYYVINATTLLLRPYYIITAQTEHLFAVEHCYTK